MTATGSAASIPDGSITSAKIADSTIVNADISGSAAIDRSKISGLPTSSTDNTLPKFDSTGGALQTSGIVVDDNNRLRVASGSSGGLEIGSSGVLNMSGTGGPSGISAPVGSTWRQTNANASHGSLSGLLWNKAGTGTTEGIDWLVDYEGRWVSYTPTIGGFSLGTGSTTEGKYTRRGKTATFKVLTKMGTSPTAAGAWTTTLPVTAAEAGERYSLTAYALDAGANYYDALALYDASTQVAVYGTGTNGVAVGLNALGFTWAVNDIVSVTGTYEVA